MTADFHFHTDVLIIGGGPAGSWAALQAVKEGAKAVLVDKRILRKRAEQLPLNFGTGVWYVKPYF